MADEINLKPCPACGSENLEPADGTRLNASCRDCGVFGPEGATPIDGNRRWNEMPRRNDERYMQITHPAGGSVTYYSELP